MDLFDAVADPATGEDEEPPFPTSPLDDDLEAQFCGRERAEVPSWSAGAVAAGIAWRAFLAAQTPERAAALETIEEQAYRAARIRKLARIAAESTLRPGDDL